MPNEKKLNLIYIEWQDAVSNSTWFSLEGAIKWHDERILSVHQTGYVIKEDARGITLAGRYTPEDTEEQYGQLQYIPKPWILRRINLNKAIKLKKK